MRTRGSQETGPRWVGLIGSLVAGPLHAQPLGTSFTYQGRLTDAGNPADGGYDLQLRAVRRRERRRQVGPTLTRTTSWSRTACSPWPWTSAPSSEAAKRCLEIGVRPGASTGAYTPLGGRQELTPSPNALAAQRRDDALGRHLGQAGRLRGRRRQRQRRRHHGGHRRDGPHRRRDVGSREPRRQPGRQRLGHDGRAQRPRPLLAAWSGSTGNGLMITNSVGLGRHAASRPGQRDEWCRDRRAWRHRLHGRDRRVGLCDRRPRPPVRQPGWRDAPTPRVGTGVHGFAAAGTARASACEAFPSRRQASASTAFVNATSGATRGIFGEASSSTGVGVRASGTGAFGGSSRTERWTRAGRERGWHPLLRRDDADDRGSGRGHHGGRRRDGPQRRGRFGQRDAQRGQRGDAVARRRDLSRGPGHPRGESGRHGVCEADDNSGGDITGVNAGTGLPAAARREAITLA